MIPDSHQFGLGGLPSPPDPRDFPISKLFAASDLDPAALVVPPSFTIGRIPPVTNQGTTPECVAFSQAYLKSAEDVLDQGAWFAWDRNLFFSQIGGGPNGAYGRAGLARLLNFGYPLLGTPAAAPDHKIAAYYAVPVAQAELETAIVAFGGVLLGVDWPNSWFDPIAGVLPAPDSSAGGHFIYAVGYSPAGLRLENSWGTSYGQAGFVTLPWPYLSRAFEAWKAVDVIEKPHRIAIAKGTKVIRQARVYKGKVTGYILHKWGGNASGAPCRQPYSFPASWGGKIKVAYVTAGVFAGMYIVLSNGVSAT